MPGSKTTYLADAVLNWRRGTAMPAAPAALYAGLMSTAPTEAGGGVEVSGNGYVRQAVTLAAPSGAGPRVVSNTNKLTFPAASPGGYSAAGVGIFDAAAAGNMTDYDDDVSGAVAAGDNFKIDIGTLTISED